MLLLLNALGEIAQILHGALDLALRRIELAGIHQGRRPRQTPAGTDGDLNDHRQISQQFIRRRGRLRLDLLLRSEKQLRLFQNPLPY